MAEKEKEKEELIESHQLQLEDLQAKILAAESAIKTSKEEEEELKALHDTIASLKVEISELELDKEDLQEANAKWMEYKVAVDEQILALEVLLFCAFDFLLSFFPSFSLFLFFFFLSFFYSSSSSSSPNFLISFSSTVSFFLHNLKLVVSYLHYFLGGIGCQGGGVKL